MSDVKQAKKGFLYFNSKINFRAEISYLCLILYFYIIVSAAPEKFTLKSLNQTSITFSWLAPIKSNGIISKYIVECSAKNNREWIVKDNIRDNVAIVDGLAVYTMYGCRVSVAHKCF